MMGGIAEDPEAPVRTDSPGVMEGWVSSLQLMYIS